MTEYWGWCTSCERSFYVGPAAGGMVPSNAACPVCLAPPAEVTTLAAGA